jgi:hypothetical protein
MWEQVNQSSRNIEFIKWVPKSFRGPCPFRNQKFLFSITNPHVVFEVSLGTHRNEDCNNEERPPPSKLGSGEVVYFLGKGNKNN